MSDAEGETEVSQRRGRHAAPRHRILRALWFIAEPTNDRWWRSWFGRSLILLVGVLLLTGLFISAYVGALHRPVPRDVPVGVVKGDAAAHALLAKLREGSDGLATIEYPDAKAADEALHKRRVYAVLTFTADAQPGATPTQDAGAALTVASGAGVSAVDYISATLTAATNAAGIPLTLSDIAPLTAEDPRGLGPFYLVVGWVVGGYLAATVLALSTGTVPRNFERAALRLAALAAFAALAGLMGGILGSSVLHLWPGHWWGLSVAGALIVFAAGAAASALSGWLGMAGTGVAIFLFVILGNPGSGGVFAPEFLPSLFRGMHSWVLPGLGTDLVRSVVYFAGRGPGRPVTGLVLWAAGGVLALLGATVVMGKKSLRD